MTARPPLPNRKLADTLLILLFLVALYLPLADNLLRLDHTTPPAEKRVLAPLPPLRFTAHSLARFPAKYDSYHDDHFGFRNRLIRLHNYAKVMWLRVSPSPKVVIGSDGFFYTAADDAMDYYRAVRPFTTEDLAAWQSYLGNAQQWCQARGIRFLVVVAPSKETIYPEHLPPYLNKVGRRSRLDQLITTLRRSSNIRLLDLRQPLRNAKQQVRLYDRTDSHWNMYGSFIAYQHIMRRVAEWFPDTQPQAISEFRVNTLSGRPGDLATMLGLEDVLREERITLIRRIPPAAIRTDYHGPLPPGVPEELIPLVRERPGSGLPRAVVYRDSFAIRLVPYLSEHFSRIVYVWGQELDTGLIQWEHPDIVIFEIAERLLMLPRKEPADSTLRGSRPGSWRPTPSAQPPQARQRGRM